MLLLRVGVHPTPQEHHYRDTPASSSSLSCLRPASSSSSSSSSSTPSSSSSSSSSSSVVFPERRNRFIQKRRRGHRRAVSSSSSSFGGSVVAAASESRERRDEMMSSNVFLECLNESTKFVVSATAMLFLLFHPTVETCWCLLGSIVNSVNGKLLKRVLNHSRPNGAKKVDPGMPSSHATSLSYLSWYAALAFAFEPNAFGLATHVTRAFAISVVSLGAFLAYLRVKLGFHTWPQVLVGYGLGSSTASLWIVFGKSYLLRHLARRPEDLKNLHACLVVAIGLFALSAITWVKELVASYASKRKTSTE